MLFLKKRKGKKKWKKFSTLRVYVLNTMSITMRKFITSLWRSSSGEDEYLFTLNFWTIFSNTQWTVPSTFWLLLTSWLTYKNITFIGQQFLFSLLQSDFEFKYERYYDIKRRVSSLKKMNNFIFQEQKNKKKKKLSRNWEYNTAIEINFPGEWILSGE